MPIDGVRADNSSKMYSSEADEASRQTAGKTSSTSSSARTESIEAWERYEQLFTDDPDGKICGGAAVCYGPAPEDSVELCARIADLPGNGVVVALDHHWLRYVNVHDDGNIVTGEAGMGPAAGGVPGLGEVDLPFTPTTVNDHTNEGLRSDATCTKLENVDADCVERELVIGRDTGPWSPWNHCQTFVADVVEECTVQPPPSPVDPEIGDAGAAAGVE